MRLGGRRYFRYQSQGHSSRRQEAILIGGEARSFLVWDVGRRNRATPAPKPGIYMKATGYSCAIRCFSCRQRRSRVMQSDNIGVERRMRPRNSHDSHQEPRRRPIPNLSLSQPSQFHRETQLGQFSHIQAFPVGLLRRGPCRLQDYRWPMNVYKKSQFSYVE